MAKKDSVFNKPVFNSGLFLFILVAIIGTWFFVFFHPQIQVVSSFYLILSQIYLGYFIFINNPRSEINLSFALFSLSLAGWNYFSLLIMDSLPAQPFFWADWLIFIAATLMIFFLFEFTQVFPKPKNYFNNLVRWLAISLPLFLIGTLFVNHKFIISGVELINGIRTPLFGGGYYLFSLFALTYLLIASISLVKSYLNGGLAEKAKLFYFLVGALFSVSGFLITNLILPWLAIASLEWMGAWFSLIFIVFISFAITKHQLLNIAVVINRALAEMLAVVFHGAVYCFLAWFYVSYISEKIDWLFLSGTIFYGIIVGQTHQPIRIFLQTTSEKIFLRGKYDYYNILGEATAKVAHRLSVPSILEILYGAFNNAMEVSQPKIFLPEHFSDQDQVSTRYLVYNEKGEIDSSAEALAIAVSDRLAAKLLVSREPFFADFNQLEQLFIPCLLEDRLIAFFVLGPKLSEDAYTSEDTRLLKILASQAALALDHARSYEKIKADLDQAQRQLSRSERLASLGTLIAGVTHEIRNPLAVIRSETEQLTSKSRSQEELLHYQGVVLKYVDRIAAIVQRMLAIAKERPLQLAPVDINESLNMALQLVQLKKIELIKDLQLLPLINADQLGIEEVFMNLIQNAVQAMPEGGSLSLRSYVDNGRAVVEISDTGKGIPPELQEKIFDPFFSTRHEGTGLGLSIAYRIIREHGADIKVISEAGQGTTFRIVF